MKLPLFKPGSTFIDGQSDTGTIQEAVVGLTVNHYRVSFGEGRDSYLCTRSEEELAEMPTPPAQRPKIVCLCGSTQFQEEYEQVTLEEGKKGNIVLTVACFAHRMSPSPISPEEKAELDILHKEKIRLADRVIIICPGNYIGESTKAELDLAQALGKDIEWRKDF